KTATVQQATDASQRQAQRQAGCDQVAQRQGRELIPPAKENKRGRRTEQRAVNDQPSLVDAEKIAECLGQRLTAQPIPVLKYEKQSRADNPANDQEERQRHDGIG